MEEVRGRRPRGGGQEGEEVEGAGGHQDVVTRGVVVLTRRWRPAGGGGHQEKVVTRRWMRSGGGDQEVVVTRRWRPLGGGQGVLSSTTLTFSLEIMFFSESSETLLLVSSLRARCCL